MKQSYNPYLPSFEYVPDGEPHVFGDRVYLYGSHDRANGRMFCMNDYVCYSASVTDLTEWRYEGVIYRADQDPRNPDTEGKYRNFPMMPGYEADGPDSVLPKGYHAMWAPDVCRGADGRYYLYYCLDCLNAIGVAVCDSPAGKYQFVDFVRYADGQVLGEKKGDTIPFDPGVFMDDDGSVYLYSGNGPMRMDSIRIPQASLVMKLAKDMLTMIDGPKPMLPLLPDTVGTSFEGHAFFEASSIRKINGKYYFVYSSVRSQELCYCVSDKPDEGYQYGGTLVDIGDVQMDGRAQEDQVNPSGNTHGGIECINGQWYVFYHRQTNRTNFSRQACAEKITMNEDGSFRQVEVTSCGMNAGPLTGHGMYPAYIASHQTALVNGKRAAAFSHPLEMKDVYPYMTQDCPDLEPTPETIAADQACPVMYLANLRNGSCAGYKYFDFQGVQEIAVEVRGDAGTMLVSLEPDGAALGVINISEGSDWHFAAGHVNIPVGVHPLYFTYKGAGKVDFRRFRLD